MTNAISSMPRIDLRYRRAAGLTAALFDAIRQHIPDDAWGDVHEAILRLFHERGVEVLTDADRQQYGLPARGPEGWTVEEIIQFEKLRLDAMMRPPPPVFVELPDSFKKSG